MINWLKRDFFLQIRGLSNSEFRVRLSNLDNRIYRTDIKFHLTVKFQGKSQISWL